MHVFDSDARPSYGDCDRRGAVALLACHGEETVEIDELLLLADAPGKSHVT